MMVPEVIFHGCIFEHYVWSCIDKVMYCEFGRRLIDEYPGASHLNLNSAVDRNAQHDITQMLLSCSSVYSHVVLVPQKYIENLTLVENENRIHVGMSNSWPSRPRWPKEWHNGWNRLYQYAALHKQLSVNLRLRSMISMPKVGFSPSKDWRPKVFNVENYKS